MAIAFVQEADNATNGNVSTLNKAFGSNCTSGNKIVVGVFVGSGSPTISCIDSQSNTYTSYGSASDTGQGITCQFFVATVGSTAANTVTINLGASAPGISFVAAEYSGLSTTQDGTTQSGINVGTVGSTTTLNTSNANDILISFGMSASTGQAITAGTGYTMRVSNNAISTAYEDQIVTSTTSTTGQINFIANSHYVVICMALQASSGGGGGGPLAFVQANKNNTSSNVTSLTCAFSSNQTAGNTNFVGVQVLGGSSPTITLSDTAGNTYTSLGTAGVSAQSLWIQMFRASNVIAGANTVKATLGVAEQIGICIAEFKNVSTTQDSTTQQGNNFGGTLATTSLTTTNTTDLVVSFGATIGTGATLVGTGFTMATNTANAPICGMEYQITAATGTYLDSVAHGAMTIAANQWYSVMGVAFQQQGGGGSSGSTTVTLTSTPMNVTGVANISFGPVSPTGLTGTMSITGLVNPSGQGTGGGGGPGPASKEGPHEGIGFWGGGSAPYG